MTWKRVATAVVLIPLVVGLVLRGTTAVVSVALGLVIVLALLEYFAMGAAIGHRGYRIWTGTCALALVYLQWLHAIGYLQPAPGFKHLHMAMIRFARGLPEAQAAFFLFVLGLTAIILYTRRPLVEALPAAGMSSSALILVAFPLTFAVRIHAIPGDGPWLLLFSLVIIWVGDTVAYFVGRAIGRHAFAPKLSPKKTWEGAFASLAGSALMAFLFMRWVTVPFYGLLGMAIAGNVAGQAGDLLESAYKRSAGVKDSGTLLPGHGGILDRIDALILAIPVVWYYWSLFYSPSA